MNDSHDSYIEAIMAIRLLKIIRGEVWADDSERFDLVLAAALARLP